MCTNNIVCDSHANRIAGTRTQTHPARGFSLVEAIVFIVIVSVALAGVLSVMNLTTQRSADPLIRKQAIAVAESLLEEISLQSFSMPSGFPGPYTQASRPYFDSIDDYNNFVFPTPSGIYPIDSNTVIPSLTGYKLISVTVVPAALGPAANQITAASISAKLITVTVQGPDGVSVALSGYRTAYGL